MPLLLSLVQEKVIKLEDLETSSRERHRRGEGMRGDERPMKLENFLVHFSEKELMMVIWGYKDD